MEKGREERVSKSTEGTVVSCKCATICVLFAICNTARRFPNSLLFAKLSRLQKAGERELATGTFCI
jgi:hypothetical protein